MRRLLPDSAGTWWFIFLILLYFAAAVWLAIRLPAHATPNELLNFEYIQVMRQIRGLPNRGLVDSEVRYTEWHQPPLYFVFAELSGWGVPVPPSDANPPPPIDWPANPAYLATHHGNLNPVIHITPGNTPLLYTSRFAAALLGILGLAALFRAGRGVYSASQALLMISLLAFQPNYLHLSASVNNDMPLAAVSAMVLAYTILIIHNDKAPRAFFGLGLLAAAAILTKANGVFVLAYLGAALLAVLLRHRNWGRVVKSAVFTLAGLIPLWAAWMVLNTIRLKDSLALEGSLPVGRVLALRPADFALLLPWLDDIGRSFWLDWSAGDVGYGPDWYYLLWAVFLLFALLGWLRRDPKSHSWQGTLAVLLGIAAISYLYFAVKALTVKEAGFLVPEGRWWLPVMPGIAWLAAAGYARWWPSSRRDQALIAATLVPVLSTFALLLVFFPALYPRAQRLTMPNIEGLETAVIYDDTLALLDAQIDPLMLNQEVPLTLTWQALENIDEDYTIAVQLLVPWQGGWRKLDEQYSYPGLGLNPTSDWQEGEIYRDTWTLKAGGELDGPTLAQLLVHVQEDGRNLPAARGGEPIDPPIVSAVPVRPSQPLPVESPLPEVVSFGDAIELAGMSTEQAGDDLLVTLWWRAAGTPDQEYTVFLHVLDDQGSLLAQDDAVPAAAASPTAIWQAGDVIRDRHRISGASGAKNMLVGLYDPASGERLPASVNGQPLTDNTYQFAIP
ncbi:MAG: glycosyltransferase family 39 protein [Candidatus Promineifilaceae bacterium]